MTPITLAQRSSAAVDDPSDLIGGTPLVRLGRLFEGLPFEVYGKLEKANPAGSVKDRAALSMLQAALSRGELIPGISTVVESSSGNLGIALAQLCNRYGLRFTCVTDTKATPTNIALMRAFGAHVEVITAPDSASGEFLPARIARVRQILAGNPMAWWPNQYANLDNAAAHAATMRETLDALGRVDVLVCTTGSCGTLHGSSDYLRRNSPGTIVVAVDAIGSVIFDQGGPKRPRKVPGHGAAVRPALMQPGLADWLVLADDAACVQGCRELLRRESVLAGGSSGAAVTAIHQMAPMIPAGAVVVVILPDGGERYLDTLFDDDWVSTHIGPLPSPQEWAAPRPHLIHRLTTGVHS